jgi:hypothetical protein
MNRVDHIFLLLSACLLFTIDLRAQDTTKVDTVISIPVSPQTMQHMVDSLNKSPFYYALKQRYYKDETDTVQKDKFGFAFRPSLNVGVGYSIRRYKNKRPFAYEHSLIAYYGINRASFAIEYQSLWNQVIGNWNLALNSRLDVPNSVYFFGVGNETEMRDDVLHKYYRLYSTEFSAAVGINRHFNRVHFLELSPFYQSVNIHTDEDQYIHDYMDNLSPKDADRKQFIGGTVTYGYAKMNNALSPTKGFVFNAAASYVKNIKSTDQTDNDFTRYTSSAAVYLPLSKVITLAVRAGGASIQGEPEFYQLNKLGGNENLRGFRRQRFYGTHSFYNNNELRFLWPTQNRVFDGKVGFLAFVDDGRVWQPGETSNTWHVGYGGGPVIQFFNQLLVNGTIGFSKEDLVFHVRMGFFF